MESKKKLLGKTQQLYVGLGIRSIFAKIRLWDAPYLEVERLVPKSGTIVELGCGEGIFSNLLGLSSKHRKVIGIDIDKNRLQDADHGTENVSFRYGDVTKVKFPKADAFVLLHLLHHLPSHREQEAVIKKCTSKLKPGGILVIVEIEPKSSLKFAVTWLTDHFLVPWLFEKRLHSPIFFRKSKEWIVLLQKNGLNCKSQKAEKGKPFTHVIVIGESGI